MSAPVQTFNAREYAKRSCKNCYGRGWVKYIAPKAEIRLCHCAARRYARAQDKVKP